MQIFVEIWMRFLSASWRIGMTIQELMTFDLIFARIQVRSFMYTILRWIINSLALLIVTYIVPGIDVKSFWTALIVVLVLSIVNAIIRPILLILTLPINILTLGIFTLFINGFMFWIVASFIKGFEITDYAMAFWGALVYLLITMVTNGLIGEKEE